MNKNAVFDLGRVRLSGNQSIVRGALEAGVRVTTAYPGAPISDLQGSFEQLAGNLPRANPFTVKVGEALDRVGYQLSAHWGTTTNEDNAMGLALGAVVCKGDFKQREFLTEDEWDLVYGDTVFAGDQEKRIPVGSRVMCSFKHLGGNTAADALRVAVNVLPYTGSLGIASGDDRQGTSSQTMQDNKVLYAFHFRIPTLELHSPSTSHITVKNCYSLFEELGVPFVLIGDDSIQRRFLRDAEESQVARWGDIHETLMREMQCYVRVNGTDNPFDLSDIPEPARKWEREHYMQRVHLKIRVPNTKWVVLRYPGNPMAQQAQMSQAAFEDLYFRVCNLDYGRLSRAMDPLKALMEKTDEV